MYPTHDVANELVIARVRALRTVEAVFAGLVIVCAGAALAVHIWAAEVALPAETTATIARAFLGLAIADLVMLVGCRAWLMRRT